jgi:hypothetical protein
MRGWLLPVALCLILGMSACEESPTQPAPLSDCTILGVVVPSSLRLGESRPLSAFLEHCRPMYLPLDSSRVAWQSLDPATALVVADTITGNAPGPAVVEGAYGNMTQQALVIVAANVPQPGPGTVPRLGIYGCPDMAVSQRGTFGAFAVMNDGTVTRVSAAATWQSSNPSVAGLSGVANDVNDRSVDAFAVGAARITATYQGMSATFSVQVHPL